MDNIAGLDKISLSGNKIKKKIIPLPGNFNLARQELKKVALKALYKLRKEMGNHFRENVKLTMKLFD